MKNNWLSPLLAGITALLLLAGAFFAGIKAAAVDPTLYAERSRAVVAAQLGSEEAAQEYLEMDAQTQKELALELTDYLKSEAGGAFVTSVTRADGVTPIFGDREVQHLMDVHALVQLAGKLSAGLGAIAGGLAVVCAWVGLNRPNRRRRALAGALGGMGVFALGAAVVRLFTGRMGFDAMFRRLHELLFHNDLWLLNPETDILIRMMPLELFERAADEMLLRTIMPFLLAAGMTIAVYFLVDSMLGRHLNQKEEKK